METGYFRIYPLLSWVKRFLSLLTICMVIHPVTAQLTNIVRQIEIDWTDSVEFDAYFRPVNERENEGASSTPQHYHIVRNLGTASCRQYLDCSRIYPGETQFNRRTELFHKFKNGKNQESRDLWKLDPGTTFWLGWSELYTSFDPHQGAVLQIRSQVLDASGSPAILISTTEQRELQLRGLSGPTGPVRDGNVPTRITQVIERDVQENQWTDIVLECHLSPGMDGFVRIWRFNPHEENPDEYRIENNLVGEFIGPTMFVDDDAPELRWGLYRFQAADNGGQENFARGYNKYGFPVKAIMEKYLGTARALVLAGRVTDQDQRRAAFDFVKPKGQVPTCGLSGDWQSTDIGNTGLAGEACSDEQQFSIRGAGADIWGNTDAFHFLYKELTGDGEITARLTHQTDPHNLAKTGIMMRNTLDPASQHAFLAINASGTQSFQYREETAGNTFNQQQETVDLETPNWLKLSRLGNTIYAFTSTNGQNWELWDELTLPMNETIYVGMAANSHDTGETLTAVFDNVQVYGDLPYGAQKSYQEGFCFDESTRRVVIEAEHFDTEQMGREEGANSRWELQEINGASQGWAMSASGIGFGAKDRTHGARLDYLFAVPQAGTYYIWARMLGASQADNSFHIGINNNPESLGGYGFSTTVDNAWEWKGGILGSRLSVELEEPGSYTLNAWIREDGVAIDKFIITDDPLYSPLGNGPVESDPCILDQSILCPELENLALYELTDRSSRYQFGYATFAVDGDPAGVGLPWNNGLFSQTYNDRHSWWEVDLGDLYEIDHINYMGRTDCCQDRLRNAYVMASPTPFTSDDLTTNLAKSDVYSVFVENEPDPWNTVQMEKFTARYVRIQLQDRNYLSFAEVQVMGCPNPVSAEASAANQKFSAFEEENLPYAGELFSLSPNPSRGSTEILMDNELTGTFELFIHDSAGRVVYSKTLSKDRQRLELTLLLPTLSEGMYSLTVSNGENKQTERLALRR